jgi:glyoxylase-like metal-dependent hydrolase (beta-lactamase superfamily II)
MVTPQVVPRVHRLGTSMFNWYVVEEGGRLTAVDAGLPGFKSSLDYDLGELGFRTTDVEAVILTHSDADHTGVAQALKNAGARVLIHRADEPKLRKPGPKSGDAKPINLVKELWRPSLWRFAGAMMRDGGFNPTKVTDAETFGDGETLDVPGHPRVVPTPGHTPGHCSFHFAAHATLMAGDAMCTLNPMTSSTGPQLLPRAYNESNEQALRSLDALEPIEADVLLFGHGEPWREGVASAVRQARSAAGG